MNQEDRWNLDRGDDRDQHRRTRVLSVIPPLQGDLCEARDEECNSDRVVGSRKEGDRDENDDLGEQNEPVRTTEVSDETVLGIDESPHYRPAPSTFFATIMYTPTF